jgi:hypothetical protein
LGRGRQGKEAEKVTYRQKTEADVQDQTLQKECWGDEIRTGGLYFLVRTVIEVDSNEWS